MDFDPPPPGHFYSPIPNLEQVRTREKEIFHRPPVVRQNRSATGAAPARSGPSPRGGSSWTARPSPWPSPPAPGSHRPLSLSVRSRRSSHRRRPRQSRPRTRDHADARPGQDGEPPGSRRDERLRPYRRAPPAAARRCRPRWTCRCGWRDCPAAPVQGPGQPRSSAPGAPWPASQSPPTVTRSPWADHLSWCLHPGPASSLRENRENGRENHPAAKGGERRSTADSRTTAKPLVRGPFWATAVNGGSRR